MISSEIVGQLRGTHEWKAVEDHIRAAIASLDTVADIEGDDRLVAVEVLARKRAAAVLVKILSPFTEYRESADTRQAARDRAADTGL